MLLAASEDLERSIFRRSVVLLFRHSRRGGARGVILSQPLARPLSTPLAPMARALCQWRAEAGPMQHTASVSGASAAQGPLDPRVPAHGPGGLPPGAPALSHFLGGPVGLPGALPTCSACLPPACAVIVTPACLGSRAQCCLLSSASAEGGASAQATARTRR